MKTKETQRQEELNLSSGRNEEGTFSSLQMALSMPSKLLPKTHSAAPPSGGGIPKAEVTSTCSVMNSASSLLAGAAAAAMNSGNRNANRRAALVGGPSAPVVKSNVQYQMVS